MKITDILLEFAPGGNSASSYYAVTANFVNEFTQQKQEEIQDLIDAGWTKQDLAQAGTQEGAAADIAHLEQVRDGFLKGLKPGFDAYLQGDTQLKDQLGASWIDNDLPLNQDWEKIYGEPWGDDEMDEGSLNEFAPNAGGEGGNYLKALASAWYNHDIDMLKDIIKQGGNALNRIIDAQEAVEKILARGIHCGDGRVRKYMIGYNHRFDGVDIQSDDHYEYADYDDAGRDIDERTGQPWGPYDVVAFGGNELDESVAEMDGDGAGRDGSNRKSHSTYGSRDKHTVSNGPDVHLDPKSMMTSKEMQDRALDTLKKTMSKPENMAVLKRLKTKEGVAEGLNEFSFDGDDDDTPKDDPYKYPKPEQYRRSIDFFGKFEANHFDKEDMDDATGVFKGYWYYGNNLKQIAYFKFDNPRRTGSNDPGMGWYYEPQDDDVAEATGDEKFDKIMRKATGDITPADAAEYWPTREYEPIDLDPSYLPSMAKYKAQLYPLAYNWWSDGGDGTEEAQLRKLGWEPSYGDDYVMVVLSGIGHDGHIQYDIHDFDADDEDLDEGKAKKPEQPEADYGDDYQDMVARVKKLAGLGPLKTVYDPNKRVYRNIPTAVQPKK